MGTGGGLGGIRRPSKPRQEISPCLKYLLFFLNFIFLILAVAATCLGVYLACLEWRPLTAVADLLLNPAALLIVVGLISGSVTVTGAMGALRENVCLLKTFALSLFGSYIAAVMVAFCLFVLFYSDSATGLSINTFLTAAVQGYSENPNYRDLMDYLHLQLSCCGASSLGFRDWADTPAYNCSDANELPESCGVPYSCCTPEPPQPSWDPLRPIPAETPVQCWRGVAKLSLTQLKDRIYTRGCLEPLKDAFEGHAVMAGAAIGAVIVPVCLSVMFANILSKQIERQRYLLDREARKEQRRLRKAKLRIRDSFNRAFRRQGPPPQPRNDYAVVDETESASYVSPPSELRPERLGQDSCSSNDYTEPVAQGRKYQRRSGDGMAEPIVPSRPRRERDAAAQPRRRRRPKSLSQLDSAAAEEEEMGPRADAKPRRRRKKSAPVLDGNYSSASTLQQQPAPIAHPPKGLPRPASVVLDHSQLPNPARKSSGESRKPPKMDFS